MHAELHRIPPEQPCLLHNARWGVLAAEFLRAKDNPETLMPFVNTVLAQGWRAAGEDLDDAALADRVEPFSLDAIPPEVLVITCGVDCQDDRLECTFAGWSRVPGECFVLGHICIYGPITSDTVWQDMDGLPKQRWAHPLGGTIGIDGAIIDAGDGGHFDLVMRAFVPRGRRGGSMPGRAFRSSAAPRSPCRKDSANAGISGLFWLASMD